MGRIWCLDVGCADASVVLTADATFLVDCHGIEDHDGLLPRGRRLRGVFITHQHEDHYSGLEYLAGAGYAIDYLICSPYQRRRGDQSVDASDWQSLQALVDWRGGPRISDGLLRWIPFPRGGIWNVPKETEVPG